MSPKYFWRVNLHCLWQLIKLNVKEDHRVVTYYYNLGFSPQCACTCGYMEENNEKPS